MNRNDARKLAEVITNQELSDMLNAAKIGIKDWAQVSNVNKGMTKGVSWNILAKDFNIDGTYHVIAKTNMIREFGNFLPNAKKPSKKQKTIIAVVHQDPIFNNEDNNEE